MAAVTVIASGACLGFGCWLIVLGALRLERAPAKSPKPSRVLIWWRAQTKLHRWWLLGSLGVGVAAFIATGWLMLLVVLPVGVIGLPWLLSEPPQREIALLAALDRWVRLLAPSIATGKSIRDAITATRHQVPAELSEPVARLVIRMDQGWSVHDALLQMADEIASADGDAVLAALAIAAERGGTGTRATLRALGENIQERLHGLREIAAERAKPRAVVRQVTIITLAILGGAMLLGGSFFEPYSSGLGQLIAIMLTASYLCSLALLRQRTVPRPAARFLRSEAK